MPIDDDQISQQNARQTRDLNDSILKLVTSVQEQTEQIKKEREERKKQNREARGRAISRRRGQGSEEEEDDRPGLASKLGSAALIGTLRNMEKAVSSIPIFGAVLVGALEITKDHILEGFRIRRRRREEADRNAEQGEGPQPIQQSETGPTETEPTPGAASEESDFTDIIDSFDEVDRQREEDLGNHLNELRELERENAANQSELDRQREAILNRGQEQQVPETIQTNLNDEISEQLNVLTDLEIENQENEFERFQAQENAFNDFLNLYEMTEDSQRTLLAENNVTLRQIVDWLEKIRKDTKKSTGLQKDIKEILELSLLSNLMDALIPDSLGGGLLGRILGRGTPPVGGAGGPAGGGTGSFLKKAVKFAAKGAALVGTPLAAFEGLTDQEEIDPEIIKQRGGFIASAVRSFGESLTFGLTEQVNEAIANSVDISTFLDGYFDSILSPFDENARERTSERIKEKIDELTNSVAEVYSDASDYVNEKGESLSKLYDETVEGIKAEFEETGKELEKWSTDLQDSFKDGFIESQDNIGGTIEQIGINAKLSAKNIRDAILGIFGDEKKNEKPRQKVFKDIDDRYNKSLNGMVSGMEKQTSTFEQNANKTKATLDKNSSSLASDSLTENGKTLKVMKDDLNVNENGFMMKEMEEQLKQINSMRQGELVSGGRTNITTSSVNNQTNNTVTTKTANPFGSTIRKRRMLGRM